MPKALHRDYPYLNNCIADLRLMGFPSFLNPSASQTSSPRTNMFASHIAQAMIIEGCELPQLFTGVEYNLGQYEFNTSHREQDAEVLAVIPKYPNMTGNNGHIINNPQILVIYHGLTDHKLHYFTVDQYTKGSDGFGYKNTLLNMNKLHTQAGNTGSFLLTKDVTLVTSPAHKGNQYCLGTNLNCAYMTMMDTIDDAMLVSASAADKLCSTEVATVAFTIPQDSRPVNLFGTGPDNVKFIPDIGEVVGRDGYLCALRPMQTETYAADLDPQTLMRPMQEIDIIKRVKPGAKVIDIEFIFNPQRRNFGTFGMQMEKYNQAMRVYWESIVATYNQYHKQYPPSPEFHSLVTKALTHLLMFNPGKKKYEIFGTVARKQPVDFIQVSITYALPRPINKAFKITDRNGHKGVVCRICPDDEMPVDQYGIRADVVISPTSPIARMNIGTLNEPAINRISEFVRRRCIELYQTDHKLAFDTVLKWITDVNLNYASLIHKRCNTVETQEQFVQEIINDKIYLNVPSFLETITPENINKWTEYWGAHATPVIYSIHDRHNVKRTYTTKYPVLIGSKYIYCLSKLPYPTAAGFAHVSHYGIPVKPGGHVKNQYVARQSPIRSGEDENRIMCRDVPEDEVIRLNNLLSNSPRGVNLLIETILTSKYPTAIRRVPISNKDLARTSAVTAMFHHTTSVLGINTRDTLTTMDPPPGLRNDSAILGANDIHLGSGFSDGYEGSKKSDENWLGSVMTDSDDVVEALLNRDSGLDDEIDNAEPLAIPEIEETIDPVSDTYIDESITPLDDPGVIEDIDPVTDIDL